MEIAMQRGFDRVASLVYLGPVGYVGAEERGKEAAKELQARYGGFAFEPEYAASDGFFVLLRVRRAPPG